ALRKRESREDASHALSRLEEGGVEAVQHPPDGWADQDEPIEAGGCHGHEKRPNACVGHSSIYLSLEDLDDARALLARAVARRDALHFQPWRGRQRCTARRRRRAPRQPGRAVAAEDACRWQRGPE